LGEFEETFSESGRDDDTDRGEGINFECDSVAQLIDAFAIQYGWSLDYILDRPYCILHHLSIAMGIRKYYEVLKELNTTRAANSTESNAVNEFLNSIRPKDAEKEWAPSGGELTVPPGMLHIIQEE